jgi:hypothetical protein
MYKQRYDYLPAFQVKILIKIIDISGIYGNVSYLCYDLIKQSSIKKKRSRNQKTSPILKKKPCEPLIPNP